MAVRLDVLDETADWNIYFQQTEDIVASHETGKVLSADEAFIRGLGRRKRVGLMLKAGDKYFQRSSLGLLAAQAGDLRAARSGGRFRVLWFAIGIDSRPSDLIGRRFGSAPYGHRR
jgi:hypothetical protein